MVKIRKRFDDPNIIEAVENALLLLDLFDSDQSHFGVLELAEKSGLSKSTVHRLLYTLTHRGYLERAEDQKYRLALKVFRLGSRVRNHMDLRRQAAPLIKRLADQTGETLLLEILDRGFLVPIEKIESPHRITVRGEVGVRRPAYYGAGGQILCAYLDDDELDTIIMERGLEAFTPRSITNYDEFKRRLAQVRQQGFAVSREQALLGVVGVAAPIRSHSGKVVATIALAAPMIRMDDQRTAEVVELVVQTCQEISERLGYR